MIALLSLTALVLIGVLAVVLRRLLEKVEKLGARVATLEQKLPAAEAPAPPEKVVIPSSPLLANAASPAAPRPLSTPPPLPIAPPPPPPATPFNWEAFMGVKLFAWLGGLALFLGVVFLVKYSFENNLITPLGRIMIGGAVAASLLALGWSLARGRYRVTAQSLCATGIVILYADFFAAHSFYASFP
ncbi:MAG: DUF2339 domain-containing protein [Chthoniobacterales bacterium]|nr:DUF2339 domain-containing protein [Chthoniobacterales bacterium]